MQQNQNPVMNAVLGNIFGAAITVNKEVYCEICKLSLSSFVVLSEHRLGKKHKRALQLLRNKFPKTCQICSVPHLTSQEYELHVTSEIHVEKAKLLGVTEQIQATNDVSNFQNNPEMVQEPSIPPLIPNDELQQLQHLQFMQKHNISKHITVMQDFVCRSCGVTAQSKAVYDAHMASKKHRKNQHKFRFYPGIPKEMVKEKFDNNFVKAGTLGGNEFTEQNIIFYCKKCDCKMNSKLQLEVHMTSNTHKTRIAIETASIQQEQSKCALVIPEAPQQLFNFSNSAYGYGYRNWTAEQHVYNMQKPVTQPVEQTRNYNFPFYSYNQPHPPQMQQGPPYQYTPILRATPQAMPAPEQQNIQDNNQQIDVASIPIPPS